MLKETIESKIQKITEGRKALQLCLCVNTLPILAATYSLPCNKVGRRLHHEDFVGISPSGITTSLNKLDEYAKTYKLNA